MPVSIPVDAHIVTLIVSGNPVPSKWSSSIVRQVFDTANNYWTKTAKIGFLLKSIVIESPVELPGLGNSSLIDQDAYFYLTGKYPSKNGAVTLLLVGQFSSSSTVGTSYIGDNSCALSWNNTLKGKCDALAHEFGHLLGLEHINKAGDKGLDLLKLHSNLMYSGIHGDDLTAAQIKAARNSQLAKRFGQP